MKHLFVTILVMFTGFLGSGAAVANDQSQDIWAEHKAFVERYQTYRAQRDVLQNGPHRARFFGAFRFKEEYCDPMVSECLCPPGNNYLQCLISAEGTIQTDPSDIGGKGYVLLSVIKNMESMSAFYEGEWLPMYQIRPGMASFILPILSSSHTLSFPVPDKETAERYCNGASKSATFDFNLGYGAAMPMDQEYAIRVRNVSRRFGGDFDEASFIWSAARINGFKPKKNGKIGTVTCRPPQGAAA